MFKFRLAIVLLIAVFLNVDQLVKGVPQFKRCYNSSEEETHCFDVQYDTTTNQPFFTTFQNAIRRCQAINSTLVIIKNEEIDNLVQQFMKDNNPLGNQYFWLNAYQVSEYDNPDRWHWLNSTLPNLSESAVTFTYDSGWYTAVLEFRSQFYLTAEQPHQKFYFVCEYSVSNCPSSNSNNVRLLNGRCYIAVQESVSWYGARNRCLKDGGDLASFPNVTSINFTSWLGSSSEYWIGLRFTWYTWGDQGQELKYTNWAANGDLQKTCMIYCFNCDPTYTWSSRDCNTDPMYVVCHTITSLKTTTAAPTTETIPPTPTISLPANTSTFTTESLAIKEASTSIIPLAVGVGIGVGVPVIAGIAVMIICIVRKRQHSTASSVKSTNRQQAESSIDEAPTVDDRSEVGDNTTYGVVVPSKSPRETDEANEANSPTEQTVYAPLQIL